MKNLFRVYWTFDGDFYIFKFYLHEFLIVSGSHTAVKGGNKKKSGKISAPNTFMNASLYNSTGKPYRKPELDLWDKYLKSFLISERTLLRWMDRLIKNYDGMYVEVLKELRNKIKDKQL
jgi:hypothetical protein